jgi:hypothetical protein
LSEDTKILEWRHRQKGIVNNCKNCGWLNVPPLKNGTIRVYKDDSYDCTAPIPEIKLPHSVTTAYGFSWPPNRHWMSGDSGEDCPFHIVRIKK